MARLHSEMHNVHRIGWLRAAVLGANDGIISTASLMVGVAGATATKSDILVAGIAGLVAGAMSMAAGEYVSVRSQADAEQADLAIETDELRDDRNAEENELTQIYIDRGVAPDTARAVALQLMAKDALGAHARDELGISEITSARPVQAAIASACSFAAGAIVPVGLALASSQQSVGYLVSGGSILLLAILGAVGALAGRANVPRATLRVAFWGAAAMAITAVIGRLVGAQL
ncbi:MAG: VIT family protein [Pseudorhodoplanes sp.]